MYWGGRLKQHKMEILKYRMGSSNGNGNGVIWYVDAHWRRRMLANVANFVGCMPFVFSFTIRLKFPLVHIKISKLRCNRNWISEADRGIDI